MLIVGLAALVEAVAEWREAQLHAAQAAAARASAGQLYAVARSVPVRPQPARPQTAAQLAGQSFPGPDQATSRPPPDSPGRASLSRRPVGPPRYHGGAVQPLSRLVLRQSGHGLVSAGCP